MFFFTVLNAPDDVEHEELLLDETKNLFDGSKF